MKSKKIIVSILLMISVVLFTSCAWDPSPRSIEYEDLKERATTVEFINYENDNAKRVKEADEVLPFDFDKMTVIETLDEERVDELLVDVANASYWRRFWWYSDSSSGLGIKINYRNGNFLILSFNYIEEKKIAYDLVTEFDSDGAVVEVIGIFEKPIYYINLVDKYFGTEYYDDIREMYS